MKPDVSHDLVNDFTVKTAENNCTVASTSLSRPLKIWPKIDLSSAACSHRITLITMASCNKGNLTMLRIGAKISLIIWWALLVDRSARHVVALQAATLNQGTKKSRVNAICATVTHLAAQAGREAKSKR